MSIVDISSRYKTDTLTGNGIQLHKVWQIDLLTNTLLLERYGSACFWAKIVLKKGGSEVYRITLDQAQEERKEYFWNKLTRTYIGDQFSFIEYITAAAQNEHIPSPEEFQNNGLDSAIENMYRTNLQKILEQKSQNTT